MSRSLMFTVVAVSFALSACFVEPPTSGAGLASATPDPDPDDPGPDAPAAPTLPPICPPGPSQTQSPPVLSGPGAIMTAPAETCDPAGTDWVACHQHMHCPPEHTGGGLCDGANCEVHTVYRKRKDGGATAATGDLHGGTVGDNCQPATHDLMVRGQFVKFGEGDAGPAGNVTYCGSATGNHGDDANHDGRVTCAESGVNQVSARSCIESQCIRGLADQAAAEQRYGHDEPTREQGCPGPVPECRRQGNACRANYDPTWITPDHCCASAPACVVAVGATTGTCQPQQPPQPPPPPPPVCVPPGGTCRYSWNPVSYSAEHCCSGSPECVYPFQGATSGVCRPRSRPVVSQHATVTR